MALRELFASFGIEVDTKQIDHANHKLSELFEHIKTAAEGFAVYKIGETLFELARGTAEVADQIGKTSQRIGVDALNLQRWQYAAKLADVSAESLSQSLGILQKGAYEAANGGKSQAEAFRALGISVKDSAGQIKAPNELLLEMADALHKVENPTKRTALALDVLGRGGKELLPLFSEGAEGVQKLFKEFDESGAGFSEEFIKQSEEANDNITRFQVSMQGLRNLIAVELLPVIDRVVTFITRVVRSIRQWLEGTELVKVGLIAFGIAAAAVAAKILIAFAPMIATFTLIAGAIALVVLIIEDLYQMFTGGKSAIGTFIDAMFGIGTTAEVVKVVKQYVDDLVFGLKELAKYAGKAWDVLKLLGGSAFEGIKGVGGTFKDAIGTGIDLGANVVNGIRSIASPAPAPGALASVPVSSSVVNTSTNAPSSTTVTNAPNVTINAANADAKQVGKIVKDVLNSEFNSAYAATTTAK